MRVNNRLLVTLLIVVLALPLSVVGQTAINSPEQQEQEQTVLIGSLTKEEVAERRASRGMIDFTEVFLPKGTWVVGGFGSFSTSSFDNYSILVIENVTSENYSFNVTPMLSYSIHNNMTLGICGKYGRSSYNIDSAALSISMGDSDFNLALNDYEALSHNYSIIGFWRQYIPLGSDRRFALYADLQIELGGFQSRYTMDNPVVGTFSRGWNTGIGLNPGVIAFATNRVAFDVGVGVLGISYTKGEQIHNQVSIGEYDSSVLSFAVNIFSISMGVCVYL